MNVLGVNAVFHDPAAAVVVDGRIVAAAEEERFSRRKHGKSPVPFSTWELPEQSAAWCLDEAGLRPGDVDVVGYSYDPALAPPPNEDLTSSEWEGLRTLYASRAPLFLQAALPGLEPDRLRFVPHHLAHAASTAFAAPFASSAVLVLDGRGESASHLAGHAHDGRIDVLATQALPHSVGLVYEALTDHLGFRRSSDEYKVMALASYGEPVHVDELRQLVRADGAGGFVAEPVPFERFAPRRPADGPMRAEHADLACSVQRVVEEVLLDLARWLHESTGERTLTMAGGVALNCVANARLAREGPFDHVWVQPAAGDAGTALGAALHLAAGAGERIEPMTTAALGRGWSDLDLQLVLATAGHAVERSGDLAGEVAAVLAANGTVGWFQGRSEFGPRALGHRSLLADPRDPANLDRLNDIKEREQFRPVAPLVLLDRAPEIFDGVFPSPYMLFVHDVREEWRSRIPAAVHVDGTARIQTVDPDEEPLLAEVLRRFEAKTGVPVLINTSLNTAGRPMVDHPRDALELWGSSPLDVLAVGPFLLRRATSRRAAA